MQNDAAGRGERPLEREVQAFHNAGRDLIGIALRSLDEVAGGLSLPKFRMLLTLAELGRVPSGRLAAALEVSASTVTRMADRLVEDGLVGRGVQAESRRVVTLELTPAGRELVEKVLAWRHEELRRLLSGIQPAALSAATDVLEQFISAASQYSSAPDLVAL